MTCYLLKIIYSNTLCCSFLGAFAKLRKAIISFMSVCLSFRRHGTTRLPVDRFWLNLIFELFYENLSKKFKFNWNPKIITGNLDEGVSVFMEISRWILLRVRNVLNKVTEKIKMHFLCSVTFFRTSWCLRGNVETCGGAREAADANIIWRIAFCISKAWHVQGHASVRAPTPTSTSTTHARICTHR
jgi:hypothetical protein